MKFKKSVKFITTRICLFILLFFMFTSIIRAGAGVIYKKTGIKNNLFNFIFFDNPNLIKRNNKNNDSSDNFQFKSVNWKELYPFENSFEIKESIVTKINNLEYRIVNFLDGYILGKISIVEWGTLYEKYLKWNFSKTNELMSGYFELDNNYIVQKRGIIDTSLAAKSLNYFNLFCENNNFPLVYIQVPTKVNMYDNMVSGVIDFSNQNADIFLDEINKDEILNLDLRKNIDYDKIKYSDLFFKTDHHWKPETGLWATKNIAQFLNNKLCFDLDTNLFDYNNFNFTKYKNNFLGSFGRRLTLTKCKPEDIFLITPKQKQKFQYKRYNKNSLIQDAIGDFDVLLEMNALREGDFYNKESYSAYMHGRNISVIDNLQVLNNKKILLIGDSYTNVVAPFLALSVNKLERIDLEIFDGSLEGYINKNGPYDVVLVMLSAFPISSIEQSHWDFR